MGVRYILLGVVLFGLLIAGCRYTAPGEIECTPPAVKMLDINGNSVCVLPEIKGNQTAPTGGVIAPVTPEQSTPSVPEVPEAPSVQPVETPSPISEIPQKIVKEGELVSFPNLAATDPDGDKLTYTFTSPLNDRGQWQTKVGDSGQYRATITASDGKNTASQEVLIIVQKVNAPPVIKPIADVTVNEGDTIALQPVVSDPDGDKVTVSYSGWMTQATYKTTFDDAGSYKVNISASDGVNTAFQMVNIRVNNVNRPPIVAPIADVTVTEGDKVVIEPTVTDPDRDVLKMTFSKPLDSNGMWQTEQGDAGTYKSNVSASDGSLSDTKTFNIIVKSLVRPPTIEIASEIRVKENDTVVLTPIVSDPQGLPISVTYSGWMSTNTKKTTFDDSGEYIVTITASNGVNKASKDIKVIVENVNRPPVFVPGSFK